MRCTMRARSSRASAPTAARSSRAAQHTERLLKSCDYLDIPHPYTADEIEAAKAAALAKSGLTDAYVRPVVWRGSGAGHGRRQRAQPGASRDRGLGVGRLLRRRQDEGRQARRLEVEAAEPGDDPLLRQGGGALHDLHHVQARGRGQGLLGRDHDGLPRLRRRGDRGQRLLREGRRGAHAAARLLPERHHPADGAADAEGEGASRCIERHIEPQRDGGLPAVLADRHRRRGDAGGRRSATTASRWAR